MNLILRGVRLIDAAAGLDAPGHDVWIGEGRILAVQRRIEAGTVPVLDLTPRAGQAPPILCPGFIDLHTHLREPGGEEAETVASGAAAAAAGGFTAIVAMANTTPPVDTPERVCAARARAAEVPVRVLTVAALSRGLAGGELVDIAGCAAAGACAFSDDGRNGASLQLLSDGLRAAAECNRPVLVHAEDEGMIGAGSPGADVTRLLHRPAEAEIAAVEGALQALRRAGCGRLHLQHLSTAGAVELLASARAQGLPVTAEATPHHLAMWAPVDPEPDPPALLKVNPPLRSEHDRAALIQALREGVVDAVATDHAPHPAAAKAAPLNSAAPGMTGLETALAVLLTCGGMGGDWLPVLIERLTAGPHRVLGDAADLPPPGLRLGEPATCVLFDPGAEWVVGTQPQHSLSSNTPWGGRTLRGRVLLTVVGGRVAFADASLATSVLAGAAP